MGQAAFTPKTNRLLSLSPGRIPDAACIVPVFSRSGLRDLRPSLPIRLVVFIPDAPSARITFRSPLQRDPVIARYFSLSATAIPTFREGLRALFLPLCMSLHSFALVFFLRVPRPAEDVIGGFVEIGTAFSPPLTSLASFSVCRLGDPLSFQISAPLRRPLCLFLFDFPMHRARRQNPDLKIPRFILRACGILNDIIR